MERPGKHLGSHLRRRRTQLVFDSISDLILSNRKHKRQREREREAESELIALNAVDCKLHLAATPFTSLCSSSFGISGLMPDEVMMKLCYAEVEALGDKVSHEVGTSKLRNKVLFSSPVFSPPLLEKELRMRSIRALSELSQASIYKATQSKKAGSFDARPILGLSFCSRLPFPTSTPFISFQL